MAEKLLQFGAIPLTFSDSSGHIYEPEVSRNRIEDRIIVRAIARMLSIGSANVPQECTASRYTWRHHYMYDATTTQLMQSHRGSIVRFWTVLCMSSERITLWSKLLSITLGRHSHVVLSWDACSYGPLSYQAETRKGGQISSKSLLRNVSRLFEHSFMDIRNRDVPSVIVDGLDLQRRRSERYPRAKRVLVCFGVTCVSVLPLQLTQPASAYCRHCTACAYCAYAGY